METPLDWKFWTRLKKNQFHFRLFTPRPNKSSEAPFQAISGDLLLGQTRAQARVQWQLVGMCPTLFGHHFFRPNKSSAAASFSHPLFFQLFWFFFLHFFTHHFFFYFFHDFFYLHFFSTFFIFFYPHCFFNFLPLFLTTIFFFNFFWGSFFYPHLFFFLTVFVFVTPVLYSFCIVIFG